MRSIELGLLSVNDENISNQILKIFEDCKIPVSNLVSVYMDNYNVMRGARSGVHARLKADIPSIVDCGGDVCHIVNNAAKRFTSEFGGMIEDLLDRLHVDCMEV